MAISGDEKCGGLEWDRDLWSGVEQDTETTCGSEVAGLGKLRQGV